MKLNDENLDYPDSRPLNPQSSVKYQVPDWMRQMIDARAARRKAQSNLPAEEHARPSEHRNGKSRD